ncbi:hypothetical protein PsYK624_011770 [Phanerochaete sordida]|uniref:Uncharacterized protein n=1 Tax=Phanerochaete sordida TaxID=48140 RepID=A0A9P3FZB9_9APHY|nr:hypothetical protein PsYK624_011770 [Phanerochaete sordida]
MPSKKTVRIPTPRDDDPEHVALLLHGCNLNNALQEAIRTRDQREDAGLGDTEDGQHLRYPVSPTLDPAIPDSPLSSAPPSPEASPSVPTSACGSTAGPPFVSVPSLVLDQPSSMPKAKNHQKRYKAKKAAKIRASIRPSTYKIRSSLSRKYQKNRTVVLDDFKMLTLKTVALGAWIARRSAIQNRFQTLEEVLEEGLELVQWDGITTVVLCDEVRNICGVLEGIPGQQDPWKEVRIEAARAAAEAGKSLRFGNRRDRRGPFKTIAVGVSYGGGQKRPGILRHSKHNQAVLARLMANPAMRRIAGFASSGFAFFAPRMFRDYATKLDALFEHYTELGYNWNNSVFPAASFNFGPNSASYEHNDHGNRAAGWCSIYCDGSFDPRYGGHLILREFGIVVEFPPGATILIPSACIRHGNIPVREGETRWSFAQYASGGLFRYVEYGFKSWACLSDDDKDVWAERRAARWVEELGLLSRVDNLAEDQRAADLLV